MKVLILFNKKKVDEQITKMNSQVLSFTSLFHPHGIISNCDWHKQNINIIYKSVCQKGKMGY